MPLRDVDVPRVLERLGIETRTKGRELWAPCPFHRDANGNPESEPSFRVRNDPRSDKHGFWQCFGGCPTGARGGGIVGLIRRVLDLPDRRAVWRWIKDEGAEREPTPPPKTVVIASIPARPLRGGMAVPRGVVVAPLASWPRPPRDYLVEDRGVPAEQAERWGIGYAATGRLVGRIYLPIHDRAGRLINYTGRIFCGSGPKTKEPHERDGADKGSVFGERFWPAPGKDRRVVVACEGALDALAVERATGHPVGAIFGSEILPGHLLRLGTFALVVVCADPDEAGDKFWYGMRRALARHAACVRAELPPGADAADLGRSDPDVLRRAVERAISRAAVAPPRAAAYSLLS
jgi:hypothetical protein